jgi:hypothetical protein
MLSDSLLWQVIATIVAVSLQTSIAYFGWRYTEKNTRDTLDVQQLVSNRATASFIAEKRQKWIDELRADMAFHLALSQEIVWAWQSMKTNTVGKVSVLTKDNESKRDVIIQGILEDFAKENGSRDREHQERHIRIKLRLNIKEELHIKLRGDLDRIRGLFPKIQNVIQPNEVQSLVDSMITLVNSASDTTQTILKNEWQRLKTEVAYPEVLMVTIPHP